MNEWKGSWSDNIPEEVWRHLGEMAVYFLPECLTESWRVSGRLWNREEAYWCIFSRIRVIYRAVITTEGLS